MAEVRGEKPCVIQDEITLCASVSGLEREHVRELATYARARGQSLIEALVDRGGVDEGKLLGGLARELELPYLEEPSGEIPGELLSQVPAALALRHHSIPLGEKSGRLQMASSDPFDWEMWDELEHVLGRALEKVLSPRPTIERLLKGSYGLGADTVERLVRDQKGNGFELLTPLTRDLSEEEAGTCQRL